MQQQNEKNKNENIECASSYKMSVLDKPIHQTGLIINSNFLFNVTLNTFLLLYQHQ